MTIIEIVVSPKGETRVETEGFAGSECQQASRFVEEALGKSTHVRITEEFYQASPVHREIKQRP